MRGIGHHARHRQRVDHRGAPAGLGVAVQRGVVAGEHGVEGVRAAEADADEDAEALGILGLGGDVGIQHGLLRRHHGELDGAVEAVGLGVEQGKRLGRGRRHQQIGQTGGQRLGHGTHRAAGGAGGVETGGTVGPQGREHAHARDQHRLHCGPTAEPCTSMGGNSPW